MKNKKIYCIDANGYIHRAYHALPLMTTSRGQVVNAVYGFLRMMLKILNRDSPEYIVVCFDSPGPTFRKQQYQSYKANRPQTPEDLKQQIKLCRELVENLNLPFLERQGYEADDLIATLTEKAKQNGMEVVIVSSDKDVLQLVDENVKVLNELKNIIFDEEKVKQEYGVSPSQIKDVFGLSGDAVDNIPGVSGIGEKTAIKLIQEFGSIENLYANLEKIPGKLREKLSSQKEIAFLSKQLATLDKNVSVDIDVNQCRLRDINREGLIKFLKELEFRTVLNEIISEVKETEVNYHQLVPSEIKSFIETLSKSKEFAFYLTADGVYFSFCAKEAFYLQGWKENIENLKFIFQNSQTTKCGVDIKSSINILFENKINLGENIFDLMVAGYLLNPSADKYDLDSLLLDYLGVKISEDHFQKVDFIWRLYILIKKELVEKQILDVFLNIEMPLLKVLSKMERNGIKVNIDYLKELSKIFEKEILKFETQIYQIAGGEFNLNSPQQLSFVLFKKLRLTPIKKTKTGFSTREDVLIELSKFHPLPALILKYREFQKLKSTYIDGLLKLVDPSTARIHTTFNQTGTVTGRLSSVEPNLQNIPAKSELGLKIRKAFIPEKGYIFLSADYAQIDLRVLAHFSKDENLLKAFFSNEDVHLKTASQIFNVPLEKVTEEMRNQAKRINFGIVYGMSPYRLSQDLGISLAEAEKILGNYFTYYSKVKKYQEEIISFARQNGYVSTLIGRRRYLEGINSKDINIRSSYERMAINTPIQGSSADIIKIAMVNIDKIMEREKFNTKMLLQIHDELVFEVPLEEKEVISEIVKKEMEGAVELVVPLKVNISLGGD